MRPVNRDLEVGGEAHRVDIQPTPQGSAVEVCIDGGEPLQAEIPPPDAEVFAMRWGKGTIRVAVARALAGNQVEVAVDGERFVVAPASPRAAAGDGGSAGPVRAPMPGKVVELPVAVGDRVARGDKVVVIEAMKLRTSLTAGADGTVVAVGCALDDQVTSGQVLVEIEGDEEEESDG